MTHMEPTDDLGLSPEFLADEDIARDVDEYDSWHDGPSCGGPGWQTPWGWEGGNCPGCRKCDPPDHECKPYGFGIETFEDPALEPARAAMQAQMDRRGDGKYTSAHLEDWGMYAGRALKGVRETDQDRALFDLCRKVWSKQSKRRLKHSKIVWDRLCDECQTHKEAVARYKEWAKRAVTIRYRDEEPTR